MTATEESLYQFIIRFKEVNGFSPSYREMSNGLNTKSFSHIRTMLEHLEDEGYISMKQGKARTIRVLKFK